MPAAFVAILLRRYNSRVKSTPADIRRLLVAGFEFGPFKTEHHRRIVDAAFRCAFIDALVEQFLPRLTVRWTRMEGTVAAEYDAPQYMGPLSVCKYKYRFEGSFFRGSARERLSGSFEYQLRDEGFELRFGRIDVTTLRDLARHRRRERDHDLRARRKALKQIDSSASVEESWSRCAQVWTSVDCVFSGVWSPSRGTPFAHTLCEEFGKAQPGSRAFLRKKLRDPDPRLAAYSFRCLIRLEKLDRRRIPKDLLSSRRTFEHLVGCFMHRTTISRYFRKYFAYLDAGVSPLDEY